MFFERWARGAPLADAGGVLGKLVSSRLRGFPSKFLAPPSAALRAVPSASTGKTSTILALPEPRFLGEAGSPGDDGCTSFVASAGTSPGAGASGCTDSTSSMFTSTAVDWSPRSGAHG